MKIPLTRNRGRASAAACAIALSLGAFTHQATAQLFILDANVDGLVDLTDPAVQAVANINNIIELGGTGPLGLGAGVGAQAQAAALNLADVRICLDIGIFDDGTNICVLIPDPDGDGPDEDDVADFFTDLEDGDIDGVAFDSINLSPILAGIIAADALPGAVSQRYITRQAMQVGAHDLNARLLRMRAGLKIPTEAYHTGAGEVVDPKNPVVVPTADPYGWEIFAQGNVGDLNMENFPVSDLGSNIYTGTLGIERRLNDFWSIGLAGTWVEGDGNLDSFRGDTDISGTLVSAYVSHVREHFYLDALYSYGFLDHDLSRRALNGLVAQSEFDSNSQSIQMNTGLTYNIGRFIAGPYLGVEYYSSDINGYRERGAGLLNMTVDDQGFDALTSELGWQISFPMAFGNGTITPQLRAAWVHEYLQDSDAVSGRLSALPMTTVSLMSPALESDYGLAGLGVAAQLSERTTLSFDYEIRLADDVTDQTAGVVLSVKF